MPTKKWLPLAILFKLTLLTDFLLGQIPCENGFCHQPVGDLLVGRGDSLTASSTCGLFEPQKYCIIGYLEDEQKCFTCDSRYPYNPVFQAESHLIENVITTFEPDRKKWWQSENGLDHVSIRLDLENLFQFSHLILTFKTFRPAAMLVERSTDYGQTWKVFRYFAQDCATSFPDIPSRPATTLGDVVCDSRYSDIEPSTEGEVVFKALDPSFEIEDPYAPYIQELITLTNLRINFTKLHTLGDTLLGQKRRDPLEKYYYALYEMIVRGSCFCNGHASYCGPVQNLRGDVFHEPGMVHGSCLCEHNTDGLSCERCKDFYNDAPWRPAEGSQENACQKCECNGHSESCHFDMAVYLSNNRISGGVCEDCQHNTMGQHCDRCKLFFYQDPERTISDPRACIPCECDPEGTLYNGLCEDRTDPFLGTTAGQCHCKENVEGVHCDKCKPNYYGLSGSDPLGCQPCSCNPSGSLSFSACDPVTGECLCQRFATGQHCEECPQGYWGLGSNLHGCSPCGCDIGGAHNNLCTPTNGQCECLPNIVGRQCSEPAPGYFFLPLDYYIYEAEDSMPLPGSSPLVQPTALPWCDVYFRQQGYDFKIENGKIVLNRNKKRGIRKAAVGQDSLLFGRNPALDVVIRESVPGKPVTWSGPGFARVRNGAGLRFTVNNIPFPMDFNIIIRYEPETLEDWIASIAVKTSGSRGSEHCGNTAALQEPHSLALPYTSRMELLPAAACFEPGTEYFVDVYFSKSSASDPGTRSSILVDSLGLIPRISSVENFCDKNDLEEYQQYHCIEIASEIGPHILPEACEKLIASLSARIHNGAVSCRCHPQGSINSNCEKLGGQCQCKPNVMGRCCDKCSAGSHSFGSQGCLSCDCHPQGSVSALCDQVTGQCSCRPETDGRRCSQCLAGYFGFPHCRPCPCNGFAELCDAQTGACLDCRGFTAGANCERCVDGYYGNPLKGEPCRPCMCPDSPTSSRYFAHSCYQDPWTLLLVCNCLVGYSGDRCDECPGGFYRNPDAVASQCLPCSCNNNIDVADPDSCDKDTGECLKCLHNTHGPSCEFCKPGYFGSAFLQNCRKCNCNPLGVDPVKCPSGNGFCMCDQMTGICPCLPHVVGAKCDQCAAGYWNMVQGTGCRICDCNPRHSQNNLCDQLTGQCLCKVGYTGRRCDACDENYFGDSQIHCFSCKCSTDGTLTPGCDKDTGACNCRVGVTGRFCDQCARGYMQEFPSCRRCHVCFDQWDNAITSLSQKTQQLMRFAATLGDKRQTMPGCDVDLKGHEDTISEIERILKSPTLLPEVLLSMKKEHGYIRQKVLEMYRQPGFLDQFPDLNSMIEGIRKDADHLSETLQKMSELHQKNHYIHLQDSLNKINNYYQITLSAGERISGSKSVLTHGGKTRSNTFRMLDDLVSKESAALGQLKLFNISDIQHLNEKICGLPGNFPCGVSDCGGALCRDSKGNRHCGGPNCNGALPLSTNAIREGRQTVLLLNNLTNQMQGSEEKIEGIRKMTGDTKKKASLMAEELEKNKDQIERERESIKLLIKRLKNFLVEESAPPEDIEKVANYVLGLQLPGSPEELRMVLDKLKSLMAHCEVSPTEVNGLSEQMEEAQGLLAKAQEAEKVAKSLPTPDELISSLKDIENIQRQTRDDFAKLNGTIEETKTKIAKAENHMDKTDDELVDFSEKQSELEDEIASLKTKLQMSRGQVTNAKSEAEKAQNQAVATNKEFANLKKEYASLQEKLKAKGLPLETLEKLNRLRNEAEKLAKETEKKMKRIADLENKIQELNRIKQNKADQLRQLEDQVTAIKDEIMQQSNKYAICKS
ncbi:laminin subunit beta-4 isoform X1 [Podarcis raffonei]|uniref:laminin subunit beta-4 isoform X1 n=1 Tax=Podarcis raffonei TaxID=65483 RepID=UPI00232941AF|nr:laminin subunit beta-4 isoform X1 [Podarcis raffonei]